VGEGRARSRGHRPTDLARRIEAQEVSLERHMEEGEEVFDILVPAPQQGMSVRYLISYRSAKQELKRAVMAFGSLALGSICIGVALVMLLSRIATGPLVRLTKASERVREGELSELAGIESRDEVGQVARAFSSVCEELRRNLLKFERANRELQRLDQLKSEFLANVSHELRTPLTSMRGYVDYLLKGKMGEMNEAQRRGLDVVQKNLIRLIKRVESLLTMSKEQMHSNELEVRPFSLRPLLEEVLSGVELESEGKGLVLELDIPEDLPPLLADRERVSQAVENLLSNAVKFTPEGGEIRVSARGISANDKRHVEVSVSDTGIGIPADELPRIFDKFHQADSSERRSYSGIGLGLAIVKQIVDKHHGKIEVESEEGKGTTFRLLLPAY